MFNWVFSLLIVVWQFEILNETYKNKKTNHDHWLGAQQQLYAVLNSNQI